MRTSESDFGLSLHTGQTRGVHMVCSCARSLVRLASYLLDSFDIALQYEPPTP